MPPVCLLRTLMMPRPCCAPITRPPLIIEGNTAMPSAFSMIARGTALSAAPMISSSTAVAFVDALDLVFRRALRDQRIDDRREGEQDDDGEGKGASFHDSKFLLIRADSVRPYSLRLRNAGSSVRCVKRNPSCSA